MANIPISALPNVKPTGFTPSDLLVLVNYFDPPFTGVTKNTELSGITSYVLNSITANTFTYNQMSGLTSTNSLVPGQFYFITNADIKLYGGTLILIQAVTTNKLALQAEGVFYTPKYKQGFPGLGIWSITNTYTIGDKVIWGGYVWTNTTGNAGVADDIYTLNAFDWSLIPYNTTDYNVFIDEIHYDFDNDRIIYRKDKSDNEVSTSEENIKYFESFLGSGYNPIKTFQWGNDHNQVSGFGVGKNLIRDSLFECINFKGNTIINNIFEQQSYLSNTTFLDTTTFSNNYLGSSSVIKDCVFSGSVYFDLNTIKTGSQIYNVNFKDTNFTNNTLDKISYITNTIDYGGASMSNNSLSSSYFYELHLFNSCTLNYNSLNDNCYFTDFSLTGGTINSNTLESFSYFNQIYLDLTSLLNYNDLKSGSFLQQITAFNSSINKNSLTSTSYITNCSLTNTSNIADNELSNDSYFSLQVMDNSNMINNILSNSSYIDNHTVFSGASNINYNTLNNGSYIFNNSLDNSSTIQSNNLINYSYIQGNSLISTSNIKENYLENLTYILSNVLTNSSSISQNEIKSNSFIRENNCSTSNISENRLFGDSYIFSNVLDSKSGVNFNDLFSNSYISTNSITGVSSVNNNVITNNSYMLENILNGSYVQNNKLQNLSRLTNNTIYSSYIENNSFQSDSLLEQTTFSSGNGFQKNDLFNTYMNFNTSGVLSQTIAKIHSRDCNISDDISSATIIYGNYSKWIFQNSAPTPRLSYYDASDVLNIVNINA